MVGGGGGGGFQTFPKNYDIVCEQPLAIDEGTVDRFQIEILDGISGKESLMYHAFLKYWNSQLSPQHSTAQHNIFEHSI